MTLSGNVFNNISLLFFAMLILSCDANEDPRRLEILFLGHDSEHHNAAAYAPILAAYSAKSGINITYSEDPQDLNQRKLNLFDGLILYANHDSISPSQERALLNFVRGGKGFIPLHCASYCFRNSENYVSLVGGQFKEHGYEAFTATFLDTTHFTTKGIGPFETLDETYVHHKLNEDLVILMERHDGDRKEPWTWVRTEGKGRVFYTAYGHDANTWEQPGFLQLVQNGILWAVGDKARSRTADYEISHLDYSEAILPNYEKRDPPPKLQAPLSAKASMTHIQVPPGFELELFAQEPMIVNPIFMNWDHLGRLWVIETTDYPNVVRDEEGVGDDSIKILEDTDGDGIADKVTVFAQDLNIPTSMVFVNGGVLVAQAPHFLFLKDTDGDDIADIREAVMSGWGVSDTHAGPSNLRYGFDNRLWGTVGYAGFSGMVDGKQFSFDQALYNFSRDYKDLQVHSKTTNNTWGLGFNEEFDIFVSTANNTHSAYATVPLDKMSQVKGFGRDVVSKLDGHYFMHPVTKNVRQVDVFGGFTAAAGHSFYTARKFPKEYWNRIAFVSEPTGHLLHQAVIEPFGAGFLEKDGWNLLASSDEWVSPVQAEVGPDGDVWVLDWYNFIIQHNPTPEGFENGLGNAHINPYRDKSHGRIYRITPIEVPSTSKIVLDPQDPQSLLAGLQSDNLLWRLHAQRLIVEHDYRELTNDLLEIISTSQPDEIGLNPSAVHAIWTLQGMGLLTSEAVNKVVIEALNHEVAGVRKAAIQALPATQDSGEYLLKSGVLQDKNPNIRLAALIKSLYLPPSIAIGEVLYQGSLSNENAADLWLSKAIQAAALHHKDGFISLYENGEPQIRNDLTDRIYLNYQTAIYPMENGDYKNNATNIANKEITIKGGVWVPNPGQLDNYLLFAHGDSENGYAVFGNLEDWKIYIRQHGRTYQGVSKFKAPRYFNFRFSLSNQGVAAMEIDGKKVVEVKAPGMFLKDFTQGLRLGMEPAGIMSVNPNEVYQPFNQNFIRVVAEITPPVESPLTTPVDIEIRLQATPLKMKFNKDTLEVNAGEMVRIVFENPDFMQHNLLIIEPGRLDLVGAAADAMVSEADAAERNYVPDIPEILFSTELLNPNEQVALTFTAPTVPGYYPFVCTFPGHWRTMNGILVVK